ncbi:MAG: helix-turn-helix domain-containing protein [Gammaproteobacteria bacterium]
MTDRKNPTAVKIGQRIKQARRMAGFDSAAQLLARIPEWGSSRLGNYEAGISLPSPDDVQLIAQATGASPCWMMFGSGPIRASGRDTQAIRHQNLVTTVEQLGSKRGQLTRLLKALGISRKKLDEYLANPFQPIAHRLVRRCEKFLKKPPAWMDEQHVETDPVCASFPEDMRRLMMIYSGLPTIERKRLLRLAATFAEIEE